MTGLKTVSYKVRRNDNLSKIARRFKTEHEVLVALNRMKDPDFLSPGQIIKVPEALKVSPVRVIKKADRLVINKKKSSRKSQSFLKLPATEKLP